ncbi:MAG TPA: CotH kinase family protein, partial [Bacteroidia bacterium]|nr:CotH kinase family protein [Bacteroidia bacterium]
MLIKGDKPPQNKFLKSHFFKRLLLLLVLSFIVVAGFKASSTVKTKGYTGLADFITTVSTNYWQGRDAEPGQISIEIKEKDLKKLKKNRAHALERGVIINDLDGDYVPATLEYKGHKMNVKLRLKGHMTDHLQDNKWSFRIKVKDKDSFLGMKRFSLQHPGTRGYIYEWIYHQLMKKEDIIALRYEFTNVMVNGKDWGIYAIEENFDQELIENNNRKKGPIIRFNPDLYWADRLNEMNRLKPVAEFASFYSANPEAYREEDVLKDSLQTQYYLKALALMEGFRSRKITASEAFDVPRMAKFNALIDLVGGQHSIDWSDIKYYYNPITGKLEPVAYESFTTFPFESIAGNYKYTVLDSTKSFKDLHTALFSDSSFFKAYIHELERVSNATYLDTFFKEMDSSLQKNLAILYKEFPYKKFEKENYYANQRMIKKILNAP